MEKLRDKFLKAINTWYHIDHYKVDCAFRSPIRHYRNGKFLGTYEVDFFSTTNWPNPDNDPDVLNRYTKNSINRLN